MSKLPYELDLEVQKSFDFFDSEALEFFIKNNINKDSRVLDVGAGSGKYWEMLKPYTEQIDAVEIHMPYIDKYLRGDKRRYRAIYNVNILDWYDLKTRFALYDFIIFGDIWEHLGELEADYVLCEIMSANVNTLIQVPYMYEQGESDGNIYEIHKQPDLTLLVMQERYPELTVLATEQRGGLFAYIKK